MEFPCLINNQNVTLVDMPGFDDSDITDVETFAQMTEWLRQAYLEDRKLSAIVYLHRITDTRVPGSAKRNLHMFRELCGKNFYPDIMLVTTMWDSPPSQRQIANEKQLKTSQNLWGDLIQGKAKYHRFNAYDDPLSPPANQQAMDIIQKCLSNTPTALQVQEEMVVQRLAADQTSAGMTVNAELDKVKSSYDREVARLKAKADKEREEMKKRLYEAEQRVVQAKADAAEKNKQLLATFSSAGVDNNSTSGSGSGSTPGTSASLSQASIASLLITAVKSNDTKTARRLIHTNNANANMKDSRGRPIISYAVEKNYYNMVGLLLDNGAEPTATDRRGASPLHVSARKGYVHIAKKLIRSAKSLEKKDKEGHTPLYVACAHNFPLVVKALLEEGAKVGAKSRRGNTVLHAAARKGRKDLCKILVNEYEAKASSKNDNGRTAAQVAEHHGHPNTASWLRKHG